MLILSAVSVPTVGDLQNQNHITSQSILLLPEAEQLDFAYIFIKHDESTINVTDTKTRALMYSRFYLKIVSW